LRQTWLTRLPVVFWFSVRMNQLSRGLARCLDTTAANRRWRAGLNVRARVRVADPHCTEKRGGRSRQRRTPIRCREVFMNQASSECESSCGGFSAKASRKRAMALGLSVLDIHRIHRGTLLGLAKARACPKDYVAESLSASFVGKLCRNRPFSMELRQSVSTKIDDKVRNESFGTSSI